MASPNHLSRAAAFFNIREVAIRYMSQGQGYFGGQVGGRRFLKEFEN
jgi:hypothetical protein